jgi:hypothetical protein
MEGPRQATLVCVLCSRLVDQSAILSLSLLQFLASFLSLPGPLLPAKVCAACHLGARDCLRFQDSCLRSLRKLERRLERTEVCPAMLLGRAPEEAAGVQSALREAVLATPVEVERAERRLRREAAAALGLPGLVGEEASVQVRRGERRAAEVALRAHRRAAQAEQQDMGAGQAEAVLAVDPYPAEGLVRGGRCEVQEGEESELEVFPSFGPYQCEICQAIIDTKQEFVRHIKALHRGQVDEAVLLALQSDLKKRRRKERKRSKYNERKLTTTWVCVDTTGTVEQKKKVKRRRTKQSNCSHSDTEYLPKKKKAVVHEVKQITSYLPKKKKAVVPTVKTISSKLLDKCKSIEPDIWCQMPGAKSLLPENTPVSKKKADSRVERPSRHVAELLGTDDTIATLEDSVATASDTTFNFKASIAKRYEAEQSCEERDSISKQLSTRDPLDLYTEVAGPPPEDKDCLLRSSFDRLTSEMGRLHGAAGSSTPWREMHDTFFGP